MLFLILCLNLLCDLDWLLVTLSLLSCRSDELLLSIEVT